MNVSELLDFHISKLPSDHIRKRVVLAMTEEQYNDLCIELKREVKRYKGYRVLKVINDEK